MDSREPHHQPSHHHHHHHHHHQQQQPPPNIMVGVGPTPYPPSMMAPTTARFPFTSVVHHQHQQHQHQQQQQQQHHQQHQQQQQQQHHHQQPPAPPTNNNGNAANDNNNAAALYDGSSSALKPCGFPTTDSASVTKKKRGRPRKYSPDGNIALGLSTTHASPSPAAPPRADSSAVVSSGGGGATPSSEPLAKKHRGRPPGSGKKQMDALGAGGIGFTPHVILVESGEDVAAKIMAFCQQGPRTVCILSANGAICNVTLKQPTMLGGTVTYEGRFEIISLSGSLLYSENNSDRSRPGGLNVSLAGSDGRVLGGGVAGMLTAASPVQVIVGSFIEDGKKSNSSSNQKSGPSTTPSTQMLHFGAPMTPTSPTSQGASSESSDDNDHSPPPSRGPGLYNNASQPIHNMSMYHHQLWAGQTQQ